MCYWFRLFPRDSDFVEKACVLLEWNYRIAKTVSENQRRMEMRPRVLGKACYILICVSVLSLVSFGSPTDCHAEEDPIIAPLSITPFRIVLNAKLKGELQDIQGIINMSMQGGDRLDDYEVNFLIEGDQVAQAFAFRYCYIDDNFLASFDRQVIQDYLIDRELEGTLNVRVEGWYTATASEGPSAPVYFAGSDMIEVFAPGVK